ncbi:MAG: hypothetical protein JWR22_1033 [Herminiimonas sp.]|nr:hypothetical protein [Herminiimonas sp.]
MKAITLIAIATTTFLGGCMVYDTPRGEGGYSGGGVYRQEGPRSDRDRDRERGERELRRGDDRDERRGDDRR